MSDNNPNINLSELNQALSQNVIHYNPTRIDYTINDFELTQLEEYGKSIWKDTFFTTIGIAIPTIVNGCVAQSKLAKNLPWTNEIFLNYLVGGITGVVSILCFIFWRMNKKRQANIIEQIKQKPQFSLPQGH
jgi:hypothetical protein